MSRPTVEDVTGCEEERTAAAVAVNNNVDESVSLATPSSSTDSSTSDNQRESGTCNAGKRATHHQFKSTSPISDSVPQNDPFSDASKIFLQVLGHCSDVFMIVINNTTVGDTSIATSLHQIDIHSIRIIGAMMAAMQAACKNEHIRVSRTITSSAKQVQSLRDQTRLLDKISQLVEPQLPTKETATVQPIITMPYKVLIESLERVTCLARNCILSFAKNSAIDGMSIENRLTMTLVFSFIDAIRDANQAIKDKISKSFRQLDARVLSQCIAFCEIIDSALLSRLPSDAQMEQHKARHTTTTTTTANPMSSASKENDNGHDNLPLCSGPSFVDLSGPEGKQTIHAAVACFMESRV